MEPRLLYFAPGVILALAGIGGLTGLVSDNVARDDGESLAVQLSREREGRAGATYWTESEYEKLKKKQR